MTEAVLGAVPPKTPSKHESCLSSESAVSDDCSDRAKCVSQKEARVFVTDYGRDACATRLHLDWYTPLEGHATGPVRVKVDVDHTNTFRHHGMLDSRESKAIPKHSICRLKLLLLC